MECAVITTEASLAAVMDEWRALHLRAAQSPYTDPLLFQTWWRMRGPTSGRELHVTTGRQEGRLVAVAPMVVTRRWGMRMLEWGANEVFDYCDPLLESEDWSEPLWQAIRQSRRYDFGRFRDTHRDATSSRMLQGFAQALASHRAFRIRLEWASGQEWMERMLSPSTRSFYRRAERRLGKEGLLRFEIHDGDKLPARVLEKLVQQKVEWLRTHDKPSWLLDDDMSLLNGVIRSMADVGRPHLCWLQCGDEIIATHLGFIHHDILHWYLPAYAMDWARFAPGRLLLLKLIASAIDAGLAVFDFMRGEEDYKAQLATDYCELTDFIFARSSVSRLAERALIALYLHRHPEAAVLAPRKVESAL